MKFSEKMCLKKKLKFPKTQGFTLPLEDTVSKNHRGVKLTPQPPTRAVLGLSKEKKSRKNERSWKY